MDEKKKILKLLAEKKITATEAQRLLEALSKKSKPREPARLIFRVLRDDREEPVFNLEIPLPMVKIAARIVPPGIRLQTGFRGFAADLSRINWRQIFQIAARGELGEILTLDIAGEDGFPYHLRVFNM